VNSITNLAIEFALLPGTARYRSIKESQNNLTTSTSQQLLTKNDYMNYEDDGKNIPKNKSLKSNNSSTNTTSIIVQGIPTTISGADLRQFFSQFTGNTRTSFFPKYCFVEFSRSEYAAIAIEAINRTSSMNAELASSPTSRTNSQHPLLTPSPIIFVKWPGGLPDSIPTSIVSSLPGVLNVRKMSSHLLASFKHVESASAAIQQLRATTNFIVNYADETKFNANKIDIPPHESSHHSPLSHNSFHSQNLSSSLGTPHKFNPSIISSPADHWAIKVEGYPTALNLLDSFSQSKGFLQLNFEVDGIYACFNSEGTANDALETVTNPFNISGIITRQRIVERMADFSKCQQHNIYKTIFISKKDGLSDYQLIKMAESLDGFEGMESVSNGYLISFIEARQATRAFQALISTTNLNLNFKDISHSQESLPPSKQLSQSPSRSDRGRVDVEPSKFRGSNPYASEDHRSLGHSPREPASHAYHTLHVVNIITPTAQLYKFVTSLPGFRNIVFKRMFIWLVFESSETAQKSMRYINESSVMKAHFALHDQSLIPQPLSLGSPSLIIKILISHDISYTSLLSFMTIFPGFENLDFRLYESRAFFDNLSHARHALDVINTKTSFRAVYDDDIPENNPIVLPLSNKSISKSPSNRVPIGKTSSSFNLKEEDNDSSSSSFSHHRFLHPHMKSDSESSPSNAKCSSNTLVGAQSEPMIRQLTVDEDV